MIGPYYEGDATRRGQPIKSTLDPLEPTIAGAWKRGPLCQMWPRKAARWTETVKSGIEQDTEFYRGVFDRRSV
jgi:hypothetical protein